MTQSLPPIQRDQLTEDLISCITVKGDTWHLDLEKALDIAGWDHTEAKRVEMVEIVQRAMKEAFGYVPETTVSQEPMP